MKAMMILALIPAMALATNTPSPVPSADAQASAGAKSHAASIAGAAATSASHAEQTQTQTATGGFAEGGAASQSQTASNEGVELSAVNNFDYPKQAPSVAQGSLMVGSCGAGGNGGGSNSNGSAFLGFAYTPKDCKLLLAAQAYQSLGMWDSACEMVNGIKAVKARWADLGVDPPSCEVKPPVAVVPAPVPPVVVNVPSVDTSQFVTRPELAESQKRQDEAMVGGVK